MKRMAIVALAAAVGLVAANRVENALRVRSFRPPEMGGVVVPLAAEEAGGHVVLTVDDAGIRIADVPFAAFSELGKWAFDPGRVVEPPAAVAALDGKRAAVAGFMFGASGKDGLLERFHLVPTAKFHDKTAMLDELPTPSRRVFVIAARPVQVETVKPVIATGTFRIDPLAPEGRLYVLESAVVQPSAEPPVSLSPADVADAPWFDYFWLQEMGTQEARGEKPEFPAGLSALEGRKVAVEGWLFDRQQTDPPTLIAGREWWNGCCEGEPPTYYNSLLVSLDRTERLPAAWTRRGSFAGVLKLNRKTEEWKEKGIARLEGARSCPPRAVVSGPYAPLWIEIAALVAALALVARAFLTGRALRPRRSDGETGAAPPAGGS